MTTVAYETVDVFTTSRYGGNPLAVVPDARGLSDELMQQIAAEFGYSETTFVLPPDAPAHTARVRIFTPTTEVPFAGHPNVGTAFVLARRGAVFGRPVSEQMLFEERAGLVAVTVARTGGVVSGAAITAPEALVVGPAVEAELVAACASLASADVALAQHAPHVISVGLPFVTAELISREALARARPNGGHIAEAAAARLDLGELFALFLYVPSPGDPARLSARMLVPLDHTEDPATGSASAALGAYLAALRPERELRLEIAIEQGVDMGRPSQIRVIATKAAGAVQEVVVGGDCVAVMRGEILL